MPSPPGGGDLPLLGPLCDHMEPTVLRELNAA